MAGAIHALGAVALLLIGPACGDGPGEAAREGSPVRPTNLEAPEQVGLYEAFELRVRNEKSYSNPFDLTEVKIEAAFTAPSGRQVDFYGFHDGEGDWKVRFLPDEIGTWRFAYTWSDASPGDSGRFEAVPSGVKGPLRIDPQSPHTMVHADGQRFFWNGDSEWFFLSDDFSQEDRFAAIDFLAEMHVNNLLMVLVNDDDHDVFPWRRRNDLARFDVEKLRRWEEVVSRMAERGIIADLWFYADDSPRMLPPHGSFEEDLLFLTMIARFAGYWNVTWNLALEHDEYRSESWVRERARFVKEADPFGHLLGVHRTDDDFPFAGDPYLDHTSLQRLRAEHPHLNRVVRDLRARTADAGRPIPILFEEFFIEGSDGDIDQFRKGAWAIATAGGFLKAGSMGWWIGTHYSSAEHFRVSRLLHDFFVTVPYWEMEPIDVAGGDAYAMAAASGETVAYLPSGGTVELSIPPETGPLSVIWTDPRDGRSLTSNQVVSEGMQQLTAPGSEDWVLHLIPVGSERAKTARPRPTAGQ